MVRHGAGVTCGDKSTGVSTRPSLPHPPPPPPLGAGPTRCPHFGQPPAKQKTRGASEEGILSVRGRLAGGNAKQEPPSAPRGPGTASPRVPPGDDPENAQFGGGQRPFVPRRRVLPGRLSHVPPARQVPGSQGHGAAPRSPPKTPSRARGRGSAQEPSFFFLISPLGKREEAPRAALPPAGEAPHHREPEESPGKPRSAPPRPAPRRLPTRRAPKLPDARGSVETPPLPGAASLAGAPLTHGRPEMGSSGRHSHGRGAGVRHARRGPRRGLASGARGSRVVLAHAGGSVVHLHGGHSWGEKGSPRG